MASEAERIADAGFIVGSIHAFAAEGVRHVLAWWTLDEVIDGFAGEFGRVRLGDLLIELERASRRADGPWRRGGRRA